MSKVKNEHRAVAGRCPSCDTRTLRGVDDHGVSVELELPALTAAAELLLSINDKPSWSAQWRSGVMLTRRTAADLRDSPAGYAPGNVYAAHQCEGGGT